MKPSKSLSLVFRRLQVGVWELSAAQGINKDICRGQVGILMSRNLTGVEEAPTLHQEPVDILGRLFHYTFDEIAPEFQKCHQDPLNVALHLITTPIGILGAVSLLQKFTRGSSAGVFMFFTFRFYDHISFL